MLEKVSNLAGPCLSSSLVSFFHSSPPSAGKDSSMLSTRNVHFSPCSYSTKATCSHSNVCLLYVLSPLPLPPHSCQIPLSLSPGVSLCRNDNRPPGGSNKGLRKGNICRVVIWECMTPGSPPPPPPLVESLKFRGGVICDLGGFFFGGQGVVYETRPLVVVAWRIESRWRFRGTTRRKGLLLGGDFFQRYIDSEVLLLSSGAFCFQGGQGD